MVDQEKVLNTEILEEFIAEIKGYFYRYFDKHSELDTSRNSNSEIVCKYWKIVDISNTMFLQELDEKNFLKFSKILQNALSYAKSL